MNLVTLASDIRGLKNIRYQVGWDIDTQRSIGAFVDTWLPQVEAALNTNVEIADAPQHGQLAICPKCGGKDVTEYIKPPVMFLCEACGWSWGKQQA